MYVLMCHKPKLYLPRQAHMLILGHYLYTIIFCLFLEIPPCSMEEQMKCLDILLYKLRNLCPKKTAQLSFLEKKCWECMTRSGLCLKMVTKNICEVPYKMSCNLA